MGATRLFYSIKTPSIDELIEAQRNRKSVELSMSDLQRTSILRSSISKFTEEESGNKNFFSFSGNCYSDCRKYKFEAICHKKSREGYIEIISLTA